MSNEVSIESGSKNISEFMKRPFPHLLILFLLLLSIRLYSYNEPFSYDIPVFSVMADELLHGKNLYVDVWDHKPPLIYFLFAMAQSVAGYGPGAVFLLNATGSLAILIGVYMAASRWGRDPWPGIWATAFWVVISGDVGLQANQPKAELFINAGFVWILALFFRLPKNEKQSLLAIGTLTTFVSLLKPHTILLPLLLLSGHLFAEKLRPFDLKKISNQILITCSPIVLIWGMIVSYFYVTDRGAQFFEAVVIYNQSYAGSITDNLLRGLSPSSLWPPMMHFSLPLVLAGLISWIFLPGFNRERLLIFLYAISTLLLIASPGRFFSYYYQLWLPLLAVFGAEIFFLIQKKFSKPEKTFHSIGIALVVILACFQFKYFEWTPMEWAKYKDDGFLNYPQTANTIDEILKPGETFFVWGPGPALYFYTQRHPPMRFVNHMPISGGALQLKFIDLMLADLAKSAPVLVVINRTFNIPEGHSGLTAFFNQYRPLPGFEDQPDFKFYALKNGALDKRHKPQLQTLNKLPL